MLKVLFARYFGIFYYIKDLFTHKRKLKDSFTTAPFDITFLALVIIILTVGLVMMFSASYVYAWYNASENDPYFYIKNQLVFAVIGVVLMLVVSHINSDIFRDCSGLVMMISFFLLIYVLINPYVIPGKEEFKRWVELPLIGSFQPSEIAKLALIMIMAFSMERNHKKVEQSPWAIFPYAALIVVICALVYLENHVSGTILMLGIGGAMMFFGGIAGAVVFFLMLVIILATAGKKRRKLIDKIQREL